MVSTPKSLELLQTPYPQALLSVLDFGCEKWKSAFWEMENYIIYKLQNDYIKI